MTSEATPREGDGEESSGGEPLPADRRGRRLVWAAIGALAAACGGHDVVAEVGKSVLTTADVDAAIAGKAGNPSRDEVLAQLVDRQLLAEEAKRRGLDEQPAVRARIAGAEREILAQALEGSVARADEAALKRAYDERKDTLAARRVHVRQIAVFPRGADARALDEAEARARELYARALAGEDFAALAERSSDDRVSGARGGDLGQIHEGEVDGAFFEAAAALAAGQLSVPVRSASGWHILKAIDAPAKETPPFEVAKGRLAAQLVNEGRQQLLDTAREHVRVKRLRNP